MSNIGEARHYRKQVAAILLRLQNPTLEPSERERLTLILADYERDYQIAWSEARNDG